MKKMQVEDEELFSFFICLFFLEENPLDEEGKNHALSPLALEIFPSRVCWEIMGPTAQKFKFPDCAKGREKTCLPGGPDDTKIQKIYEVYTS